GVGGISVSTQSQAMSAISSFDAAIQTVSSVRGYFGAIQNRVEHTMANLANGAENLTAAESRIRDLDMAQEMAVLRKNDILVQAAQAMLAQANLQPQRVLQLLN
ncbi:MAG TPA: flagellin, partial [Ruminiclostridium sp.]|nr:flagellin [Ruminiclostridium sp.]